MIVLASLSTVAGVAVIKEDGFLFPSISEIKVPVASAYYVLGDSSVDCGDNTLFYPFLHHNLSLFPCDGTDQSLIPHFLAEKIGFQYTPPFYGQNGSINGVLHGLNFGSAQATIMSSLGHEFQSLNQQIRQILETFQLLQLHLSPPLAHSYIESSLLYLSFGKDDYIDLFLHNSSGIMHKFTGPEFARILVNQMVAALRTLYAAGPRKFIVTGIMPLGCAPRTVWEWNNSRERIHDDGNNHTVCVEEINELVLQYNTKLEESIVSLDSDLPGIDVAFCDMYQGIMEMVNNPKQHGFDDVSSACCGIGENRASIGCLSMGMACEDGPAHLWWDLYNPTQQVNRLLSEWRGLDSLCPSADPRQFMNLSQRDYAVRSNCFRPFFPSFFRC